MRQEGSNRMTKTAESAPPVRSVRRALAILRAFRLSDRSLTLGEIAQRARLDKATARRLLMTLMAERLVEQDPGTKGYSLGLGVLELAAGLTPCDDLRQRAQPVLAAIAESTGATAFLGVVHDGAALCIGRVDGGEAIQIRAWSVGGRMPLNCGAGPRVLMAHRPAAELARILARPLEALTPFTPADAAGVTAALPRPPHGGAGAIGVDRITAVGAKAALAGHRDGAARIIDAKGHAILPGLVNTHTHLAGALTKALTEDVPTYGGPFRIALGMHENVIKKDDILLPGMVHGVEMLKTGTTTINECWWHQPQSARIIKAGGLRGIGAAQV